MIKGVKRYHKDFQHSYSIGAFPCLELLERRPQEALEIFVSTKAGTNEGVKKIRDRARELDLKMTLNDKRVEEISGKENAYVVATFRKFDSQAAPEKSHLVLLNPSDAGNLGTIMRTALAFGVINLVIIKPAVDHFDPKVVRASMGAIFQINLSTFDSFEKYRESFPRKFFVFSPDGETELSRVNFSEPAGLVFGTESAGVPDDIKSEGEVIRIEQSAEVDSLNLPVSVGVALYHFSRSVKTRD